jgi:hypothetical protein
MMVTIPWHPLRIHFLDALPKSDTLNAEYYRVNILTKLPPLCCRLMGRDSLFMLTTQHRTPPENAELFAKRIDSASPYTHRTHLISHHPTSFFLFGHIKHCLQGIVFPSCEELLAAIHEIVGAIPRPTSEDLFRHWMERLE